jgi:hypothetical protein
MNELPMYPLHMNQIAFYCASPAGEREVKAQLGLSTAEWIKDTVYAHCTVHGKKCDNVAELQFNYDLGTELELIRYIEGPHWLTNSISNYPFLAHIGIHIADDKSWPMIQDWPLVQTAETYRHTADHLTHGYAAGRLYSYRIYQMAPGTYIKYIKRRHKNDHRRASPQASRSDLQRTESTV